MRGVAIARRFVTRPFRAVRRFALESSQTWRPNLSAQRGSSYTHAERVVYINCGIGLVQDDAAKITDRLFMKPVGGATTPE
jgi:hypothetical protein